MAARAESLGVPLDDAWTAANYETCIHGGGEDDDGEAWSEEEDYEVLSRDGSNGMTFTSKTQQAPMLFVAEVVDPTLSFCRLRVAFAVQPTGMTKSLTMPILIIGTVTLLVVLALAASYWFYSAELHANLAS